MTLQGLGTLARTPAAAPAHTPAEQARLYVPVQSLRTALQLEDAVRKDLLTNRKVALVGASGSGKSSLAHWLISTFDRELAAVFVPVSTVMADDQFDTALPVLRAVLGQLRRLATDSGDRRTHVDKVIAGTSVGPAWLRGSLQTELVHVTEDLGPSAQALDLTDQLQEAVSVLRHEGVTLALVFDDTDKWDAARPGLEAARDGFFGVALRWLAEHLDGAVLAAVHARYLDGERREQLTAPFSAIHEVPVLDPAEFAALLERRLAADDVAIVEVLTEAAVADLYEVYRLEGSIRRALQTLQGALQVAIELRQEMIDAPHVQSAR